ncbi:hypothetical protein CEE37_03055 [candidate division LCP-89 bacterium B3_LCP]|uniref:Methyltransferase type 11 domain-containing protein n=1 Tax=candidate division LCP-89 bacterium B3_LCP TaxID=2012998 RepID=A0A532V339_UNCL8|nr:MAG: hypothetical protein CEE37_03055 [candidate division LCP-89 bacterium B3_LCP]
MAVATDLPVEVEVFGVTYERYALAKLFRRLVCKYSIKTVIEIPASGAKAMPSLYSLGFALAGCSVTLVDAEAEGLAIWKKLGLDERLETVSSEELSGLKDDHRTWDLAWNFAVLPNQEQPERLIELMKSCSSAYLMFINVNRFNVGFFMHRTVHRLWKIPWTHGAISFFSPYKTKRFMRRNGVKGIDWGVVDCPPWPDSPGFRDLRLHRMEDKPHTWSCPYSEYITKSEFPAWMKWVYAGERLPLPAILKLPYSHLYYAIGQVQDEIS